MAQKPARASRTVTGLVFLAWTAAVLLPPLGLAGWRSTRLAELSDPAVQAEWTAFREDMRTQTDRSGPVQRKVPKSVEPPELVWLRDYFWLAVAAWCVLGGVLGGFFSLVILGVIGGPSGPTAPGGTGPLRPRS